MFEIAGDVGAPCGMGMAVWSGPTVAVWSGPTSVRLAADCL